MMTGLTTRYINRPNLQPEPVGKTERLRPPQCQPANTAATHQPDRRVGRALVKSEAADQCKHRRHRESEIAVAWSGDDFVMIGFQELHRAVLILAVVTIQPFY